MNENQLTTLILEWGKNNIKNDFSQQDMDKDMALLGLDSIDVVEFCEYLEEHLGIDVELDHVMDMESLTELSQSLLSSV